MSMPNGVPQSPMWFSRMTSWPTELEHAHQASPMTVRAQVADVHLLGDVRRRVVDDDALGAAAVRTPRPVVGGDGRARASARKPVVEREVDEARPGDLDRGGHAGRGRRRRAPPAATSRGLRPSCLGERQGPVRLGVGTIGRAHHGIDVRARRRPRANAGRRRSARSVQRIGHGTDMCRAGATMPPSARPGILRRPALVAQGIEHRSPEPCAQVRILPRALRDFELYQA